MPQIIPLTSDPDRTFDVELGGNLLTLRTYYNPTVPGWYMDVEGVAKGLALVPFADVFEASPELQRTIGQMRLMSLDGADVVTDLGSLNQLWWFSPGEWVSDDEAPTLDPVPGSGGYVVA